MDEPRRFDAFVFDLDGTLLDTLPDLVTTTNMTLEHFGYPTRTREEVLSFVGYGVKVLLTKALPSGSSDAAIEAALAWWEQLYPEYGHAQSKPYERIPEIIAELRRRGKKTAILSNKFDGGVKDVTARFFPGLFDIALGEGPVPRKPDPTGLLRVIDELGCTPESTIYFGDSGSDMKVAHAAGAFAAGVTWGYQPREALVAEHAQALIDSTGDILSFA